MRAFKNYRPSHYYYHKIDIVRFLIEGFVGYRGDVVIIIDQKYQYTEYHQILLQNSMSSLEEQQL